MIWINYLNITPQPILLQYSSIHWLGTPNACKVILQLTQADNILSRKQCEIIHQRLQLRDSIINYQVKHQGTLPNPSICYCLNRSVYHPYSYDYDMSLNERINFSYPPLLYNSHQSFLGKTLRTIPSRKSDNQTTNVRMTLEKEE